MTEKYAIPTWAIDYILFKEPGKLTSIQQQYVDDWLEETFGIFAAQVEAEPDKEGNDIAYYSKKGGAFGGPKTYVVDLNFCW